jgi:MFS family permease
VLFKRPETFIVWRALAGLGGSALVALPPTYTAVLGPRQTTRAASLVVFFFGIGQAASALIGGELAQQVGWQAPFAFGLVLAGGGVLTLSLASRHTPAVASSGSQSGISGFLATARSPGVLLVIGLALIGNLTQMATVFTYVPVRAVALGATRSDVGILAAATIGAMTAANLLCGTLLAGRVRRRWIATLGLGLTGLGTVVLPLIPAYGPLIGSQIVSGFGAGLTVPPLLAAALDAAGPTRHGAASGLFQWAVSWGTFAGPAVGGLIAQWFGLDTTFVVTGGLSLSAALYLIFRPLTAQDDPAGPR